MEFESVIRGRRSIRAYKPERVPEELVREILDAARWAPSWRNTQSWNVWVLTGDALQRYTDEFRAAVERDDSAALDLPATAEWPQACSARIAATMKSRAATLEAAGEPADPAAALARTVDLCGAPCLLVFGFEDCLTEGLRQLPHRLVRPERLPRRFRLLLFPLSCRQREPFLRAELCGARHLINCLPLRLTKLVEDSYHQNFVEFQHVPFLALRALLRSSRAG